jgi:hypothetical protein
VVLEVDGLRVRAVFRRVVDLRALAERVVAVFRALAERVVAVFRVVEAARRPPVLLVLVAMIQGLSRFEELVFSVSRIANTCL